jgi:hypothetical protein
MTEEIEFILDSTEESMIGSIAHLENSEHSRRKSISCDVRKCFCRLLRLSNTAFAGGKTVFLMQEPSHFSHLKEICFTPSKSNHGG